jgi:hypothetical protein
LPSELGLVQRAAAQRDEVGAQPRDAPPGLVDEVDLQAPVRHGVSEAGARIGGPDGFRWEVAYNPRPIGQKVT